MKKGKKCVETNMYFLPFLLYNSYIKLKLFKRNERNVKMNQQEKEQWLIDIESKYEEYYDVDILGKNQGCDKSKLRIEIIKLASKIFYYTAYLPSAYLENKFPQKFNKEILITIREFESES